MGGGGVRFFFFFSHHSNYCGSCSSEGTDKQVKCHVQLEQKQIGKQK